MLPGTTCTLMLKPGQTVLRAKGFSFEPGVAQRVPADIAGKLLRGHADELELKAGEPVEPPSNLSKGAALRALVGPDRGAWLAEVDPIPEAARKMLLKKELATAELEAAVKAAGPVASALLCRLHGLAERAEQCLTVVL